MAWLPDPLSEEVPSEAAAEWVGCGLDSKVKNASVQYKNTVQAWNNWIFVTCMLSLFTIYCAMVKKIARGQKSKASTAVSNKPLAIVTVIL